MQTPWIGSRRIAVIPVFTTDVDRPPADFMEQVRRRIFLDIVTSSVDRSVRSYIFTVSYGRAILEADVFAPVGIPDNDFGQAINQISTAHLYEYACVVFPTGGPHRTGYAWWDSDPFNFEPPRPGPNYLRNWCRVNLEEGLGVWAMEILHITTYFGDLYFADPNPGRFDNMACSCGTQLSSYTKLKVGWFDSSWVAMLRQPRGRFALHPIGLLHPPPPGRVSAIKIPSRINTNRYFLVECRLAVDPYERSTPEVSSGIPSEGVVVYEVDEVELPGPLTLRTPVALSSGQTYENEQERFRIEVTSADSSSYTIQILCEGSPECPAIRERINNLNRGIEYLQRAIKSGNLPPEEARQFGLALARSRHELQDVQQRARDLCCV
jgi:hypothetical protein